MENQILNILIKKGVHVPNPETVFVSDDINPDRISGDNVWLYAGTKLIGPDTLILKDTKIGYEAPVTIENCYVGQDTNLLGGYFKKAVFVGKNSFGSNAHVREGTILEEEANAAHTVGLKQTILFPFVTLGSLINFCDCLMAGGTSRKNHSEVGSSFVHFNYTPNQDKATASMLGTIPQGVMLKSNPIFLGGQGGMVGPCRVGFGCISAAGSILRKDEPREDRLILAGGLKDFSLPREYGVYKNVSHIFNNNLFYIAGLYALKAWYINIRSLFVYDEMSKHLLDGLQTTIKKCIQERIHRFDDFLDKLHLSKEHLLKGGAKSDSKIILIHDQAMKNGHAAVNKFKEKIDDDFLTTNAEQFVSLLDSKINNSNKDYIKIIQSLDISEQTMGSEWLLEIENKFCKNIIL